MTSNKVTALFYFLFALGFSSSASALSLQEAFDQLKRNEISYEAKGTICEQVANLSLAKDYPAPQFRIINGITYSNLERVIGELDVVVLNNQSQKVELIAEVKCWADLSKAQTKAQDQRSRFLKSIRSSSELWISTADEEFSKQQFADIKRLISISNRGGSIHGFDLELPFSMQELMVLRRALLQCFEQNLCNQRL